MFCIKRIGAISLLTLMSISCLAPFVGKEDKHKIVAATTQDNIIADRQQIYSNIYKKYKDSFTQEKETVSEHDVEISEDSESENESLSYIDYDVPDNKVFKCYMDENTITDMSSDQYWLKQEYVLDYESGIYTVDGRYCCALGTYYGTEIGQTFDIVMESGDIIPCILADIKSDKHTDYLHQYTVANNTIVEFWSDFFIKMN